MKIQHIINKPYSIDDNVITYKGTKGELINMPYNGHIDDIDDKTLTIVHERDNPKCKFKTIIEGINVDKTISKGKFLSIDSHIGTADSNDVKLTIRKKYSKQKPEDYLNGKIDCDSSNEKTSKYKEKETKSRKDYVYDPFKIAALPFFPLDKVGNAAKLLNTSYENHKEIVEDIERIKKLLK